MDDPSLSLGILADLKFYIVMTVDKPFLSLEGVFSLMKNEV